MFAKLIKEYLKNKLIFIATKNLFYGEPSVEFLMISSKTTDIVCRTPTLLLLYLAKNKQQKRKLQTR